mmetsp:Transcript_21386/g.35276  ORF Transcript_21386/g.35276 Transcript_21386/m.35276 type:complete len:239 (-) Transcript_21386:1100-1816(-)
MPKLVAILFQKILVECAQAVVLFLEMPSLNTTMVTRSHAVISQTSLPCLRRQEVLLAPQLKTISRTLAATLAVPSAHKDSISTGRLMSSTTRPQSRVVNLIRSFEAMGLRRDLKSVLLSRVRIQALAATTTPLQLDTQPLPIAQLLLYQLQAKSLQPLTHLPSLQLKKSKSKIILRLRLQMLSNPMAYCPKTLPSLSPKSRKGWCPMELTSLKLRKIVLTRLRQRLILCLKVLQRSIL